MIHSWAIGRIQGEFHFCGQGESTVDSIWEIYDFVRASGWVAIVSWRNVFCKHSVWIFKLILKANNLPLDLNVHSLRHTNASLLIAQGVDVRTVASLLGHAQASTTLDIYAHAFDKNKRKAQEKLGKAIGL